MKSFFQPVLLTLLAICMAISSFGQALNHVPGQFLIQTDYPIDEIVGNHQLFQGKRTSLRVKKRLIPDFNIYQISYNNAAIPENTFRKQLESDRKIDIVQFNHILQNRAVPNDPLYNNQWQYNNTGQSGGTVGADIDMDEAWDIATGGLTPMGDTIVVAVIDDGINVNHSDFGTNRWYNHAEIPNDGIDNDNNGYVDDFLGWDSYNDDDSVEGTGSHGTPVAGIVGAKGNNGNGVAGVNWDVKLMIIEGGGDEANALAAYGYAYTFRKKYNETGGQEGAYVVATNASWGTDFGQAADAPLWCGFYDILGQEGVINCGATINGNNNVDVDGDLPTTCPSDYLIAVTNMNDNDVKVTGAGYGSTHIDLGAFGANTYAPAITDSYGGFGGTSGATPHVTGVAALMHAVNCPSFTALMKADPAAATLLIKQYILDGVDANASLSGITVTEGRLNAKNALQAILDNCSSDDCYVPYYLLTSNLTDTSVDLEYTVGASTDLINIRYRILGSSTWTTLSNVGAAPYSLTGLIACNDYEFQVQASCSGSATAWSSSKEFRTDGCCEAPDNLLASSITDNSVSLTWDAVLVAMDYDVEYRELGGVTWMTMNTSTPNLSLSGLVDCTEYEARVRTNCAGGTTTAFSGSITFRTTNCGVCVEGNYCASNAASANLEWIGRVAIEGIDNTTTSDDGYGDYTNLSTTLDLGASYSISLEPGYLGTPYDEYFLVWIDYNGDEDFDDVGELVYDPGAATQTSITGGFTIPNSALVGPARMRVSMKYQNAAAQCDEDFDYGEVEDYCIQLRDPVSVENVLDVDYTLFPNPTSDNIMLQLSNGFQAGMEVQVISIDGRLISRKEIQNAQAMINTENLSAGMYFIRLTQDGKSVTDRFVKM